eukprot:1129933-Prorocentrum_minimum.AAC.1
MGSTTGEDCRCLKGQFSNTSKSALLLNHRTLFFKWEPWGMYVTGNRRGTLGYVRDRKATGNPGVVWSSDDQRASTPTADRESSDVQDSLKLGSVCFKRGLVPRTYPYWVRSRRARRICHILSCDWLSLR